MVEHQYLFPLYGTLHTGFFSRKVSHIIAKFTRMQLTGFKVGNYERFEIMEYALLIRNLTKP